MFGRGESDVSVHLSSGTERLSGSRRRVQWNSRFDCDRSSSGLKFTEHKFLETNIPNNEEELQLKASEFMSKLTNWFTHYSLFLNSTKINIIRFLNYQQIIYNNVVSISIISQLIKLTKLKSQALTLIKT